jgi:crotonobetainyl-CoA:carnitine CoA-transferase CaiB-like acyl-CoA transferase
LSHSSAARYKGRKVPEDKNRTADSALGHLRVIELGDIPASYATRWLADLGADVIKVEPPGGDPNRLLPPFAGNLEHPERSLAFIHANTSKRSIVLDLEKSYDRGIFAQLLASAHLFVEATAPGYLEKCAFTDQHFQESFTHLVIVSLTPFGRTGPYRNYKGSDAIANAVGGFLYGQGDDKKGQCTAPSHLAYQMAGAMAAALALAGVRHARQSGAGQRIDMSLQEALTFTNSSSIIRVRIAWSGALAVKLTAGRGQTSIVARTGATSISPPTCRICGVSSRKTG